MGDIINIYAHDHGSSDSRSKDQSKQRDFDCSTCVLFSSDISLAKANEPATLPLYGLKKDRLLP